LLVECCSSDRVHHPPSEKHEAFNVPFAAHPQKDALTGSGCIPNTEDRDMHPQ
jgi:hypothetical protein